MQLSNVDSQIDSSRYEVNINFYIGKNITEISVKYSFIQKKVMFEFLTCFIYSKSDIVRDYPLLKNSNRGGGWGFSLKDRF